MEFIYVILVFLTLLISELRGALYKEMNKKNLEMEEVIYRSENVESLLQCAHKCRFIDKEAAFLFQDGICECRRYKENGNDMDKGSLSGLFLAQKIEKVQPIQLINVAFKKTAQQSTTRDEKQEHAPDKATDGIFDTYSHTKLDFGQWWSVDLDNIVDIKYMVLKGYGFSSDDNKALVVETRQNKGDAWIKCKDIGTFRTSPRNFTCAKETSARFVKVRSTEKCRIDISELEVYAPGPV